MKINRNKSIIAVMVFILAAVGCAVYLNFVGDLNLVKERNSYEKISEETRAKITSVIKQGKGEFPNVQTDSCKASWGEPAHEKQRYLMDRFLDTLTVLGERRNGKPSRYIIANFYDNMLLYIPYGDRDPQDNIVIEVGGHYYIGAGNDADVRTIINYMAEQGTLRLR